MTTATKSRPILFSAPMVRALLDGRKTQTRRMVKPQPIQDAGGKVYRWISRGRDVNVEHMNAAMCPYGVPGDRLWVKHGHWLKPASDLTEAIAWSPEFPCAVHRDYRGTWTSDIASPQSDIDKHGGFRKRPSIHMPRWASRITLQVTSVRVERVQDISEADAVAEGMKPRPSEPYDCMDDPREQYRFLWDEINGKGSWESKPWVWVIEFRKQIHA